MDKISEQVQNLRYKYLAFSVIRDAIGFYLGIPKFLAKPTDEVYQSRLKSKIELREKKLQRPLTNKELARCELIVSNGIESRISQLKIDLLDCEDVLFHDNHWLQLLNLDAGFIRSYLNKLSQATKDELAIVPNWTTKDHSLGRPYITDERDVTQLKF